MTITDRTISQVRIRRQFTSSHAHVRFFFFFYAQNPHVRYRRREAAIPPLTPLHARVRSTEVVNLLVEKIM